MTSSKLPAVPCLRNIDEGLRRRRLLAARRYAVRAIPRHAILTGQWDGGAIVGEPQEMLNGD